MKTIFILFAFCFSINSFAQQPIKKTEKLSLLVPMNYQNSDNQNSYSINLNPNLDNQIISIGLKNISQDYNFKINTRKIKFGVSQSLKTDLRKQLQNIMHKFPGDGSNLFIDARGYKTN